MGPWAFVTMFLFNYLKLQTQINWGSSGSLSVTNTEARTEWKAHNCPHRPVPARMTDEPVHEMTGNPVVRNFPRRSHSLTMLSSILVSFCLNPCASYLSSWLNFAESSWPHMRSWQLFAGPLIQVVKSYLNECMNLIAKNTAYQQVSVLARRGSGRPASVVHSTVHQVFTEHILCAGDTTWTTQINSVSSMCSPGRKVPISSWPGAGLFTARCLTFLLQDTPRSPFCLRGLMQNKMWKLLWALCKKDELWVLTNVNSLPRTFISFTLCFSWC